MINSLRQKFYRLENAAHDARAATELSRLGIDYMPWSRSALRPAALASVLNDVIVNRRKRVVELGAGISTIYLAKILARTGGQLISVDHNPEWLGIVEDILKFHDLLDTVQLVEAPMAPIQNLTISSAWYDTDTVLGAIGESKVDLVLIDGPLAHDEARQLARYPALPVLQEKLSPRCAVMLDDADRTGEREILKRWQAFPDFNYTVRYTQHGLAVLTRGEAYTSDF